ncbi:helix-turn-helix domain-containing protein [Rhodococcus sp. SORGH_AS_0301]|uniref:winged helix-turn-helix transcriptional regulator n=1 Tax=Rhodococcus sp. SORGH_AS_0301 TaxID=3041780 RepID=UPI0027880B7A|nr:helix-turn-helix domain-containing protein [Rhodococcus sp. SORGH_AS_0301]MDQ1181859.1 DNA-binding HxlR family transcriptional regulator [Rhodococcus sp. SORGH_AS_0301]
MKSYGEFCALARGLDVIGDRWTMLVVRELLIGPSRYADLHRSLPGIATNLLAQRLRSLEEAGVVRCEELAAPVSARVYSLTDWGRGLQAPLVEIARWAVPMMHTGAGKDHHQGRWMVFAIMALFPEPEMLRAGEQFPIVTVRVDVDGASLLVTSDASGVTATVTSADTTAGVTVTGTSDEVFAVLSRRDGDTSTARVTGSPTDIRRFRQLTELALTAPAR